MGGNTENARIQQWIGLRERWRWSVELAAAAWLRRRPACI